MVSCNGPRLWRGKQRIYPANGGTTDNGQKKSFTLIELLFVMLIIAIISAISIPAFISMGRGASMRSTVSSVYNTLSLARQWAITHREEITFSCYRDTATGSAFTGSTFCVTNQAGIYICRPLTNSLDVNFASSTSVTFKADGGLASGSVAKHIYIEDRHHTVTKTITIYGLTGGIKVN